MRLSFVAVASPEMGEFDVITALGERPRGYGELLERIGGVLKKMLT